jgi:ribosomal protein S18 acetylase RimI-like enzyme
MIVVDWHTLTAAEMAPLYAAETGRWRRELAWDPSASWTAVELARTTWGLPGLLCLDMTGAIRGWTFHLPVQERLDVGGFMSDSAAATAALVDALISRAGSPLRVGGLVYAAAPDLTSVLATRGVPHVGYSYRLRQLDKARTSTRKTEERLLTRSPRMLRRWSASDIDVTGELLLESYERHAGPIGAGATLDDWRTYVTNLVRHDGCGTLSPAMSRMLTINGSPAAAALVSVIAPHTAHLVQIAVHRAHQGLGIGRALLTTVIGAARDSGYSAMSLLVAEDNPPAQRLYQQAGFVERGTFVALRAAGREAGAAERIA